MKQLEKWLSVWLLMIATCTSALAQESLTTCGVELALGLPEGEVLRRVGEHCRLVSLGEHSFGLEEEDVFPSGNRRWGLVGVVEFEDGRLVRATRSLTGPSMPSGPEVIEFTNALLAGLARLAHVGGSTCKLRFERIGPETGQPTRQYSTVVISCGGARKTVSVTVGEGKVGEPMSGGVYAFEEIRSK